MSAVRSALAVIAAAATLTLAGAATAAAAPYTDDPVIATTTPNPPIGGEVPLELAGFDTVETVVLELHSKPIFLTKVLTNSTGEASTVVDLPAWVMCAHTIVATGQSSGLVATLPIFIGPPQACDEDNEPSGGNVGSGNVGAGNVGDGNVGNGNTGHGNVGNGNTGAGNVGDNNTGDGNGSDGSTGWGNVAHTMKLTNDDPSQIAATLLLGMAVTGGVGFLCTRGRRSS